VVVFGFDLLGEEMIVKAKLAGRNGGRREVAFILVFDLVLGELIRTVAMIGSSVLL
jgi:hypothetical protein